MKTKARYYFILLWALFVGSCYGGDEVTIVAIPVLEDNYAYVVRSDGESLVIDPGEADPVLAYLKSQRLSLNYILNTHHHWDHVDGNVELKHRTGCMILGPDDRRVPGLDQPLSDGQRVALLDPVEVVALAVPGHTRTHLAFYLPKQKALFSGDTLFSGGCGRIFEGTVEEMLGSFDKLTSLPPDTRVYFGHEYTLPNLRFAAWLEPSNGAVKKRLAEVEGLRARDEPTTPSTLEVELETNPFLRYRDKEFVKRIGVAEGNPVAFFNRLVELKSTWRKGGKF